MKFICNGCEKWHNDPCILDVGEEQYVSGEHMRCPFKNAEIDLHYCKWEEFKGNQLPTNSSQSVTNCNRLPKLTAEVFDRPDCPEWAQYAAVDGDGVACYFSDKPTVSQKEQWWSRTQKTCPVSIWHKFDASNWQNSLIERPAKLPDWCKVGEWCYCLDDDGNGKYFKITKLDDSFIYGDDWDIAHTFAKPARLRHYNAEEMKALIGKVIEKGPSMYIVTGFENVFDDGYMVRVSGYLYGANDLLRQFTIDNAPCGVLEHLENGEWVR